MGSLVKYGGLTTKIRGMRSKLITKDEYYELCRCETISEFVEFLKNREDYVDFLSEFPSEDYHRENIENAVYCSLYKDYAKLFRFSGIEQRRFLKLYFMRYEKLIIKKALRKGKDRYLTSGVMEYFIDIFGKFSTIDIKNLLQCNDEKEVLENLKGTDYYDAIKYVSKANITEIAEYELALEKYYYQNIWKKRKLLFDDGDLKTITDAIGTEIDLLNLSWIYRSKKYYKLNYNEVIAMLIPIKYRITKEELDDILNSQDLKDFFEKVKDTRYGGVFSEDNIKDHKVEKRYEDLLDKIYSRYFKLEPYSVAALNNYLYEKNKEIKTLITIVECIRYKYPFEKIIQQIQI